MNLPPGPSHLLAGALAVGLALANVGRLGEILLVAVGGRGRGRRRDRRLGPRLVLLAILVGLVGWWWGSARLDTIDRSPLLPKVGLAGRATVVVTAPVAEGKFGLRAQGQARTFRGARSTSPSSSSCRSAARRRSGECSMRS